MIKSRKTALALLLFAAATLSRPALAATPLGPPTFGKVNYSWGTRRPVTTADKAAIDAYRPSSLKPSFTADFSSLGALQSQWSTKSDDKTDLDSARTPASVVVEDHELQLQTLPVTTPHHQWSTGSIWSNFRQRYGFFESTFQIANGSGLNNAFWLVTDGDFEIDVAEVHYPNIVRTTLHNWTTGTSMSVGFNQKFSDDFSAGVHEFGVLWTPASIIFEVDGDPMTAIDTQDSVLGTAQLRLSTALMPYAGTVPANPAGLNMVVKSVRVYPLIAGTQ